MGLLGIPLRITLILMVDSFSEALVLSLLELALALLQIGSLIHM